MIKALLVPALALAVHAPAAGQVRLNPASPDTARVAAAFDAQWSARSEARLPCQLTRYPPLLDYGLRLWSGYSASVPAAEIGIDGDPRMAVHLRVTPDGAPPAYFYQAVPIPRAPAGADLRKVRLDIGGGFLLGPGRYRVDWLLIHSSGRACRSSWSLKAKGDSSPLAALQVEAVDNSLWRGFSPDAPGGHALIFLHASPVRPRRYLSRLSPWDRQVLLSTLGSVLRQGGFRSASLVVFDLQNRRTLFREASIDPRSLRRLARQLAQVDYGTISIDTLAQGPSTRPFLEQLIGEELKSSVTPSAAIFIGSRFRGGPKLDGFSPALREALPRTSMLAFSTPQTIADPDSLSSLVRTVRGKVFSIYSPADLASALKEISSLQ